MHPKLFVGRIGPTGGAYSAPPGPLAGFKGPTSRGGKGRGGKRRVREGKEERGSEERKGEGREGEALGPASPYT